MWINVDKNNKYNNLLIKNELFNLIIFIVILLVTPSICKISDKRLCYDTKCSKIISSGKTVSLYHSNDPNILSFKVNEDVEIYSKGAGERDDLWGAVIRGKRGYVPKSFIREKKVFHKDQDLKHEVPTGRSSSEGVVSTNSTEESIDEDSNIVDEIVKEADKSEEESVHLTVGSVSPSFEVIDGTTLPILADEVRQPEESYATKLLPGAEPTKEQPTLTIHPNVMSSESAVAKDSGSEIHQEALATPEVTLEAVKNSGSDDDAVPTAGETEVDEKSATVEQVEEENLETAEVKSVENESQADPEASEMFGDEEKVENEEPETQSQAADDILVNAYETITSFFESITTTESPIDAEVSENPSTLVPDTPEIILETTVAPEVENTPAVSVESSEASNVNNVLETDILTEGNQNPSDANVNKDNEVSIETQNDTGDAVKEKTNDGKPGIIEQDDPSGSRHNDDQIPVDFNEFPEDRNPLNVQSENDMQENPNLAEVSSETELNDTVDANPAEVSSNVELNDTVDANPGEVSSETELNDTVNANPVEISSETELNDTFNANPAEVSSNVELNDTVDANPVEVPSETELNDTVSANPVEVSSNVELNDTAITNPSGLDEIGDAIGSNENNYTAESVFVDAVKAASKDSVDIISVDADVCHADNTCDSYKLTDILPENVMEDSPLHSKIHSVNASGESSQNYWETLSYLGLTAVTTLLFSLGYYYIENSRRDGQLIAKINKLEKELLISSKECNDLDESLKSTKEKLNSIEDESFGSNEMVLALKQDLELANSAKLDLENQIAVMEKDLESATEAGLELERMLREILATNSAENSLNKSIEDLQARLNAQQAANEALTNSLQLKTQELEFDKAENENLTKELTEANRKYEELEVEVTRVNEELNLVIEKKNSVEQISLKRIEKLEKMLKDVNEEKVTLHKTLKGKEMELTDLLEVMKQLNMNNLNVDKLLDVSQVKAEATLLKEERDKLLSRLNDVEGAHQLLEEHMKVINEELATLNEHCKLAEKEKKDAETKLEVLTKFFKDKEAEHQKEEAVWHQQQGEVSTTTERLQTMYNEIQSYKQQIESLKREILDQEREYKSQMSALESKAHEQWVLARQNERRLEESKAEASQLRNRLTMVEKNLSDNDSDIKGHRMDANGETSSSSQLFLGAESSSSPIMFSNSSNIPPPPPPYLYAPPLLPPAFIPPPLPGSSNMQPGYDVGQRPPPLGAGRLSSPPPILEPPAPKSLRTSTGGRFERSAHSPSPPISSPILSGYDPYRSPPPPPPQIPRIPFHNDRILPPPPPPPPHLASHLPNHLLPNTNWGDDKHPRNNGMFHHYHRDQPGRDYKVSSASSEESIDKTRRRSNV